MSSHRKPSKDLKKLVLLNSAHGQINGSRTHVRRTIEAINDVILELRSGNYAMGNRQDMVIILTQKARRILSDEVMTPQARQTSVHRVALELASTLLSYNRELPEYEKTRSIDFALIRALKDSAGS